MPKTRAQKEQIVEKIADQLTRMKAAAFITTSGYTMTDADSLRAQGRELGVELTLAKKTLLLRALQKANLAVSKEQLEEGSVLAVMGLDDEVSALAARGMALLVSPYRIQEEPETLTLIRFETPEAFLRYHLDHAAQPHAHRLHAAGLSRLRLRAKDARLEDKVRFVSMDPEAYEAWRFQKGREEDEETRIQWAGLQLAPSAHR